VNFIGIELMSVFKEAYSKHKCWYLKLWEFYEKSLRCSKDEIWDTHVACWYKKCTVFF